MTVTVPSRSFDTKASGARARQPPAARPASKEQARAGFRSTPFLHRTPSVPARRPDRGERAIIAAAGRIEDGAGEPRSPPGGRRRPRGDGAAARHGAGFLPRGGCRRARRPGGAGRRPDGDDGCRRAIRDPHRPGGRVRPDGGSRRVRAFRAEDRRGQRRHLPGRPALAGGLFRRRDRHRDPRAGARPRHPRERRQHLLGGPRGRARLSRRRGPAAGARLHALPQVGQPHRQSHVPGSLAERHRRQRGFPRRGLRRRHPVERPLRRVDRVGARAARGPGPDGGRERRRLVALRRRRARGRDRAPAPRACRQLAGARHLLRHAGDAGGFRVSLRERGPLGRAGRGRVVSHGRLHRGARERARSRWTPRSTPATTGPT